MSEVKQKKRIAPTLISALPKATASIAKAVVEEEDKGPVGPRSNRKKAGERLKKALAILKEPKHKHSNPWVHHVRLFAEKKKVTYGCALSDPNVKKGYVKGVFTKEIPGEKKAKRKMGEADEAKKHLKFLNKISGGDYEAGVAKRRKERMEGGGISSSFLADLEKRAASSTYGAKSKGF